MFLMMWLPGLVLRFCWKLTECVRSWSTNNLFFTERAEPPAQHQWDQFVLLPLCLSYPVLKEGFSFVLHLRSCYISFSSTVLFSSAVLFVFPTAFILAQLLLQIRFSFCDVQIFLLEIIQVFICLLQKRFQLS